MGVLGFVLAWRLTISNELFDELCEVMADVTGDMSYLPDEVLAAIVEDEHAADYTVEE